MQKTCFVISPIGESGSEARRQIDGLIESVIDPLGVELGLKVEIAHKIDETGSISKQIITRLISADLVIADLTNLNANVMYELAIRHCACKPSVSIAEFNTPLPFDISDQRTIFYRNDIAGVGELKDQLSVLVKKSLAEGLPDNPVYSAMQAKVLQGIKEGAGDKDALIYNYLQKLEGSLGKLERMVQMNANQNILHGYNPLGLSTSSTEVFSSLSPITINSIPGNVRLGEVLSVGSKFLNADQKK